MKLERVTLAFTYAMIILLIVGVAVAVWHRATDTMWSRMSDVHWMYDAVGVFAVLFAVVVAAGLWFRREWGRINAISLCVIVFFMFLGIRLIAPFITDVDLTSLIDIESITMGVLAIANIIGLTRRSFKDNYSANSSLNADARKESARAG
jgi:hypothetical protein